MNDARTTIDLVDEFLEGDGSKKELANGEIVIETGFKGCNGRFPVRLASMNSPLTLLCFIHHPLVVPEDKRSCMAEAVTRANFSLRFGRFDLNMNNGDLHLQTAIPLADSQLTSDQLFTVLAAGMNTSDRYHRAFARLLYADDLSPAEAIAEIELGEADSD